MKVLVTGGSGLVGKYVVDALSATHCVDVVDLKPPHRGDLRYHSVDLLDFAPCKRVVTGYDAVVHLAGIPHPLKDPPEKVIHTNTLTSCNALEACAVNGIRRFIFLSSESTLGFAFSASRMWPEYNPIDEAHPLRPHDPYGVSKLVGEYLCRSYAQRASMQTICLRPPWIWVPEPSEIEIYRRLITEYPNWSKNLWAYIHVSDVAQAIRLCLESGALPAHDAYFISAADTWVEQESRSLLARFFPETQRIAPDFHGRDSFISWKKAHEAFGFSPQCSWRDILSNAPA